MFTIIIKEKTKIQNLDARLHPANNTFCTTRRRKKNIEIGFQVTYTLHMQVLFFLPKYNLNVC